MNDSRTARVQKIFLEALELPNKERNAWVTRACAGDQALFSDVMSLLGHVEPTFDPLEKKLDEVISDVPRIESHDPEETSPETGPEIEVNSEHFLSRLSDVGVLSPAEFEDVSDSVSSGDPSAEPRQLASRLVTEGKLTDYQAAALLKGEPDLLIDKYLILDLIDVGGMGMVFKAIHRTMNRVVAVKMISQHMLASPDQVKRFQTGSSRGRNSGTSQHRARL